MGLRTIGVSVASLWMAAAGLATAGTQSGGYTPVKACGLLSLAEMKALAPWPASADAHAKAEEVSLPQRSLCVYPTAQIQVEAYRPDILASARKAAPLQPVAGVGDEAFARNNRNLYAVLYTRVGPHLLTVEMEIPTGTTYESARPVAEGIAKAVARRLR